MSVAALFVRRTTIYRQLGADCWDATRDARGYRGASPVVAHPPCRAWGRLRHMAKPRADEKALALFAVEAVRTWGGVLEHPANSKLWPEAGLPEPGERDAFGGFTLTVWQSWFGHRAPKPTRLYVKGCEPQDLPAYPMALGMPAGRIENMNTIERERTPEPFARWLLEVASRCQ